MQWLLWPCNVFTKRAMPTVFCRVPFAFRPLKKDIQHGKQLHFQRMLWTHHFSHALAERINCRSGPTSTEYHGKLCFFAKRKIEKPMFFCLDNPHRPYEKAKSKISSCRRRGKNVVIYERTIYWWVIQQEEEEEKAHWMSCLTKSKRSCLPFRRSSLLSSFLASR